MSESGRTRELPSLLLATGNRDKVREIEFLLRSQLPHLPFRLLSAEDYPDIEPPEESGETFIENALIKAHYYARLAGHIALGDDSGLVVHALEGRPGVRSARYASTPRKRIERVLRELAGVARDERSAEFACVMALADPGGLALAREGRVAGWITDRAAGKGGFGYDPIFEPEIEGKTAGRTFAEFAEEEKNALSHRGRALAAIAQAIGKSLEAGRVVDAD